MHKQWNSLRKPITVRFGGPQGCSAAAAHAGDWAAAGASPTSGGRQHAAGVLFHLYCIYCYMHQAELTRLNCVHYVKDVRLSFPVTVLLALVTFCTARSQGGCLGGRISCEGSGLSHAFPAVRINGRVQVQLQPQGLAFAGV